MRTDSAFWDRISEKYRASPISDKTAYDATLERVASHLHKTDTVLEIGCGTGGTAHKLAPFAKHITATDFSPGMIAQAQARPAVDNVSFKAVSVYDPTLDGQGYDAVLAFNLLHLVPDFESHLARIHDVLAPGGLFIAKTPCLTDPSAQWKYRLMVKLIPVMQLVGKAPFVKMRTIAELQRQTEQAGFEIIETGNYPVQPPSHFVVARKI